MRPLLLAAAQTDWLSGLNGPGASLPIVSLLLGAVILFFGRRIFWLCVAAIGFAAGVELAPHLIQEPTPLLQLSIALVLGFVGALLAIFLQKIAIAVAGFVAGGKLAVALSGAFAISTASGAYWLVFLIGGVIGTILLLSLFDWALIFLSAAVGAHLILSPFPLAPPGRAILFVILVLVGVLAQAGALRRRNRPTAA
jgi:uncharacterized protein DUF4203